MKTVLLGALAAFVLTLVAGVICVPLLRKIKAGQPILTYVKAHESKSGTPTMGGLFFILSATAVFFAFKGYEESVAVMAIAFGLFYMLIGFLDDFIKVRYGKNEGLKPYQKIFFQTAVSVVAGFYAYRNGLTFFHIPFVKKTVDIGAFIVPFAIFTMIAVTNSVNLTDGLDGLAGGACLCYFLCFIALSAAENALFGYDLLRGGQWDKLRLLSACLAGATAGFLVFNVSKAAVFMGDTGSLSLGGFIGAISIFSGNGLFIPIIGVTFVISCASVIIQVAHFKRTRRRVFLMAPLHHHFQMKGKTEAQISYFYSLITVITGTICVIFYL